jgi:hypothetical protein
VGSGVSTPRPARDLAISQDDRSSACVKVHNLGQANVDDRRRLQGARHLRHDDRTQFLANVPPRSRRTTPATVDATRTSPCRQARSWSTRRPVGTCQISTVNDVASKQF